MKEFFTPGNLMLAIVGGTAAVAITHAAGIKQATRAPLLTLAMGAILLPVGNQFLGAKDSPQTQLYLYNVSKEEARAVLKEQHTAACIFGNEKGHAALHHQTAQVMVKKFGNARGVGIRTFSACAEHAKELDEVRERLDSALIKP